MCGCASLISRCSAAAPSLASCYSSQIIWPIILFRRSHKARISIAACAASRSTIKGVSHPLQGQAQRIGPPREMLKAGRLNWFDVSYAELVPSLRRQRDEPAAHP